MDTLFTNITSQGGRVKMYGWEKRPISPQFAVSLTAMFNLLRESKQSQPKEATWEKSTNMSGPQK